jgi:hypothetical protein
MWSVTVLLQTATTGTPLKAPKKPFTNRMRFQDNRAATATYLPAPRAGSTDKEAGD